MGGAPGDGWFDDDRGLGQPGCGAVQVLLDGVDPAGEQQQAVGGAGGTGSMGGPVCGVLDESADHRQGTVVFVGELGENGRELSRCPRRCTGGGTRRRSGTWRGEVEVPLDAACLVRQTPGDVAGGACHVPSM